MSHRRSRRVRSAVLAALILPALAAGPASAGTVDGASSADHPVYNGTSGADTITLSAPAGHLLIHDNGGATPGPGCATTGPNDLDCGALTGISQITVNGLAGNDTITVNGLGGENITLAGGSNDDTLTGGASN